MFLAPSQDRTMQMSPCQPLASTRDHMCKDPSIVAGLILVGMVHDCRAQWPCHLSGATM